MANYSTYIRKMVDYYIDQLDNKYFSGSLVGVSVLAGISRNALYDILDEDSDVNRFTVCSLGLTLKMTLSDFEELYHYKGFSFRTNKRDMAVKALFDGKEHDVEELRLIFKPSKKDKNKNNESGSDQQAKETKLAA